MRNHSLVVGAALAAACPSVASAAELEGPGRFCGYSPVIDLRAGERIVTLQGGIHGGSFRWEGTFGTLEVYGIGSAGKPGGRAESGRTRYGHVRFAQEMRDGEYVVAIWNGKQGAAYFHSREPLTSRQLAAIDRVKLIEEGDQPEDCDLRTVFAWE